MKTCQNCVLPDNFPGIRLNAAGICNFCLEFKKEGGLLGKRKAFREKFEKLLRENRGKGSYDGLLSYSGGKDSTYTLAVLKEQYGLNLLAFTVDNGFLPDQTYENIRRVTDRLSVDHVFFKPAFETLQKIFGEGAKRNIFSETTLARASTICTSCMAIVRFSALRCAVEKRIPFLIFGWSPGQLPISASIMKNNPAMIRTMQEAVRRPLSRIAGQDLRPYFLENEHFERTRAFPYNISPLAFLDYDEGKILERAGRLGWKSPAGVDANSSNCLLNSYANIVHKRLYGYNPYVFELAKLVREGYLKRAEALEKLAQPENKETVD
ncbi:MAG: hypothetical protein AB1715_10945, partial [Acidobacteriota bacterium]